MPSAEICHHDDAVQEKPLSCKCLAPGHWVISPSSTRGRGSKALQAA
jgi:hypothetical protein